MTIDRRFGTSFRISWSGFGGDDTSVRLELSLDDGRSWEPLTDGLPQQDAYFDHPKEGMR